MKKTTLTFVVFLINIFLIYSCGNSGGSGVSSTGGISNSYQGPGSQWAATLDSTDNTFRLTESLNNLTINGSYSDLSSGFKKLTVTSSSGTGAPSAGEAAYALDIPGVVLLLKPLAANSEIITMIKSGECPTSDTTLNWIIAKLDTNADASSNSQDVFGTYFTNGTSANLPVKYALDNTSVGTNDNLGTFSCSSGVADVTGAKLYLTQSSGAIVHTGQSTANDADDDGIIVAMPSQSLSSGDLNGSYVGLVFTSDETYPTTVTISGTSATVTSVNVESGSNDGTISNTITLSSFNSPTTGFIDGTLSGGQDVQCMGNTNLASSGKSIFFCSGEDPADATKLFALLVFEL